MFEIIGKYTSAKVYADKSLVDDSTIEQIQDVCDSAFSKGSTICIMPDCHAGHGCTIGTVMQFVDKVNPSLVGCDIGCGMLTVQLNVKASELDFDAIDTFINATQPLQININDYEKESIRSGIHPKFYEIGVDALLNELHCKNSIGFKRVGEVFGTIGGGNHFIEINEDKEGYAWLTVHTGSRTLGKYVEKYYRHLAFEDMRRLSTEAKMLFKRIVNLILLSNGKDKVKAGEEINQVKKVFYEKYKSNVSRINCYLTGEHLDMYLHDMKIAQEYAKLNRLVIVNDLVDACIHNCNFLTTIDTQHNYIDVDNKILHKGSISAKEGEYVLIPMNMRDGSLLCLGKGNEAWLSSAPHGAGRLLPRGIAFETLSMDEYVKSMENVVTSSVCKETIDEAPMCYKPKEFIIENTKETIDVIEILKPVYNYKNR